MSGEDWREISEEKILQANIDKYHQQHIIEFYRDFEEPKYLYQEYDVIFNAVVNEIDPARERPIKVVDLCGGAGKGVFTMRRHHETAQLILVDLAQPMLDIALERAQKEGIEGLSVVAEDAITFLARPDKYDIIILSSAIHHFKDPVELIKKCAARLQPNGLIITIADPTTMIAGRRYKFLEFMLVNSAGKKQKLKALFQKKDPGAHYDIAEYQTVTGIDDHKMLEELAKSRIHPLMHLRYPAGEKMTALMSFLRLYWAFATVLQNTATPDDHNSRRRIGNELSRGLPFPFINYQEPSR
ncbi:MAG: class I SAM-dependent methyltransferase [Syntrophomonadaceae bacterium]|nr:class I SAM-dependent methyltransferase [Syntrophomonadaceae bacterium]